jgi:GNAT superfamily N-acetyltransferase
MTIRPANCSDARAIAEILHSLEEYPRYCMDTLPILEAKILTSLSTTSERTILVALLESRVIGFIMVHWFVPLTAPLEGFISNLFVHAGFSSRGAGTALLEAVKLEAKARGCSRVALNNWRDKKSYATGFYASRGFTEKPNSARFSLNLEESK